MLCEKCIRVCLLNSKKSTTWVDVSFVRLFLYTSGCLLACLFLFRFCCCRDVSTPSSQKEQQHQAIHSFFWDRENKSNAFLRSVPGEFPYRKWSMKSFADLSPLPHAVSGNDGFVVSPHQPSHRESGLGRGVPVTALTLHLILSSLTLGSREKFGSLFLTRYCQMDMMR